MEHAHSSYLVKLPFDSETEVIQIYDESDEN